MITLKTLPLATAQEVYDQVKTHLLAQKQRSTDGGSCCYRGPNGLKCAAGILIADDEYDPKMDSYVGLMGTSWSDLVSADLVPGNHHNLIGDLQRAHDMQKDGDFTTCITSALIKVAKDYNLVP